MLSVKNVVFLQNIAKTKGISTNNVQDIRYFKLEAINILSATKACTKVSLEVLFKAYKALSRTLLGWRLNFSLL